MSWSMSLSVKVLALMVVIVLSNLVAAVVAGRALHAAAGHTPPNLPLLD